jgi:hypothetical protein
MLVKAINLQVGDIIGQETVSKKEFVLPYVRIWLTYQGITSSPNDYPDSAEFAIHREPMIKKRDGTFEPFSKDKLKRSIYKAVLDLPEEEWEIGKIQPLVDILSEWNFTRTTENLRSLVQSNIPKGWGNSYASYNKR